MNSTTGGQFKKTVEGITTNGLNAGSYQPKGNVGYKFSATLPNESALKCGENVLTNTARVTTNAGYKEDTATVTINRTCTPGEITVCELASKQIVTIKEDQFNPSKYSKNLDDCKETPVTPVTPPELPQTGAGDGIVAILGLGAMIASVAYYIASRRALGQ